MAALQSQTKSAASRAASVSALRGAWWKYGTGGIMAFVIYGAFYIAGGANGFGKSGDPARIVFFHVPVAVLSSICYFVGMAYAALYLTRKPTLETDAKSATAMELGFLFALLATITGSIFAGVQWGSFWNWDPRETSILITLTLYASYLVLRGALTSSPERRARLSAVYAIVALVPQQFLIWVVPRILSTNHPTDVLTKASNTSSSYKVVLYSGFLAFTMLFVWLFQLRVRQVALVAKRQARRNALPLPQTYGEEQAQHG